MRHVQAMQREGTSFDRYVVTDSLCCPSRASILTGRYPHSTGVLANVPPFGGFEVFHIVEERSTFATSLQRGGLPDGADGQVHERLHARWPRRRRAGVRPAPAGRSGRWTGNGYRYFDYNLLVKPLKAAAAGRPLRHPAERLRDRRDRAPRAALHRRRGRATACRSCSSCRRSRRTRRTRPRRATRTSSRTAGAARADCSTSRNSKARRRGCRRAGSATSMIADLDANFRKRAQSVQAIDRMVGSIRAQLAPARRGAQHLHRVQRPTTASTWVSGGCGRASRRSATTTSASRWSSSGRASRRARRCTR